MVDVRQSKAWTSLVEELTTERDELQGRGLFSTYKDLLKFAAAVGFRFGRREAVEQVAREIPARIFENSNDNDFVYLVALTEQRDASILAEEENEAYRIFEEYANGGLAVISGWLEEDPRRSSPLGTILARIQDEEDVTEEAENEVQL